MKLLVVLFTSILLNTQTTDLGIIRSAYKEAAHNKAKITSFSNLLTTISKDNPNLVLVAYKGASLTLQAKYAKTIKEKKEGFIEGVSYLEYAIETDPNNIELRFIRMGIQENSPKILKYKDAINQDKLFILDQFIYIKSVNLKKHIKDYILQSKAFSEEEKQTIKN